MLRTFYVSSIIQLFIIILVFCFIITCIYYFTSSDFTWFVFTKETKQHGDPNAYRGVDDDGSKNQNGSVSEFIEP